MGKQGLHEHKDGKVGGYLVGRKHTHGGIKAKNVDTNAPIELESEEVVITAPAVKSSQKHEFDGQQLTNLEILDRINVSGGGVGLMEKGGSVKDTYTIHCCGNTYKYGGRVLTDREILKQMADGGMVNASPRLTELLSEYNAVNAETIKKNLLREYPIEKKISEAEFVNKQAELAKKYEKSAGIETQYMYGQNEKGKTYATATSLSPAFTILEEYLELVLEKLGYQEIHGHHAKSGTIYVEARHVYLRGGEFRIADHEGRGGVFSPDFEYYTFGDVSRFYEKMAAKGSTEELYDKAAAIKAEALRESLASSINRELIRLAGYRIFEHSRTYQDMATFKTKNPTAEFILQVPEGRTFQGEAFTYQYLSKSKDKQGDRTLSDEYYYFLIGLPDNPVPEIKNYPIRPPKEMKRGGNSGNPGNSRILSNTLDDEYLEEPEVKPLGTALESTHAEIMLGDGGHTCGCSHSFPHHLLPVHYEGGGTVPAGLNETEEETLNFFKKHPDGFVRFHAKRTDMSHLLSAGLIYKTDAASGFYTDVFLTEKGARTLRYHNLLSGEEIMASGGKTKTIKEKVLDAQDVLKAMTSHTELRNWALSNGMDNRSAFPKFKDALKGIGVDYESIRSGVRKQQQLNLVSKIKHQVTLYVDAKASHNRFGITDEDGNVLWYGKFFDNDQDYNGEQSSGELAAAKKAVWLASKIKEAVGDDAIKLILFVDAQWLTYQDHPGQKGYALTQISKKYDIDLNVEWIPGTDNPADKWTVSSGYKKWSDNDIASLAKPVDLEKEGALEAEEEDFVPETLSVKPPVLEIGTPQETAQAGKYFKGVHYQYTNPYDLNRAIEELLDSTPGIDFSIEEKVFLKYYSGYGGLEKYGAKGVGLLYEYFTPGIIARKMWGLAYKYGYDNGSVFEPSCGIGEFFNYAPAGVPKTGFEINAYSARICKILHPDVMVENQAFEEKFIKGRDTIRNRIDTMPKYDLVIGNPPYGNFQGKFAGMGEKAYTKASNYIDYFIFRGLDLLKPGGLLIFIIGAEVQAGGIPFLQQQDNPIKREIAEKADLLDAYRLPNGVFERTDVLTDIIVLQKK